MCVCMRVVCVWVHICVCVCVHVCMHACVSSPQSPKCATCATLKCTTIRPKLDPLTLPNVLLVLPPNVQCKTGLLQPLPLLLVLPQLGRTPPPPFSNCALSTSVPETSGLEVIRPFSPINPLPPFSRLTGHWVNVVLDYPWNPPGSNSNTPELLWMESQWGASLLGQNRPVQLWCYSI